MASARLIFHRKRHFDDGAIAALKLWQVPNAVRGSLHPFKYRLYYGRAGVRLIGYDNEAGKSDHLHYGDREEPYVFETVEKLLADFLADAQALRTTDPGENR